MLDVRLFENLRFSAASGSVTLAFFALFGFIFMVTQYFQFLRAYSPLETGIRILPVAASLAIAAIFGTRLAVRVGNKAVVSTGLGSTALAFMWISTASVATPYLEIAGQMVLLSAGLGLTSAPATEAIMGVVPKEKAGIGSAMNDATRELGGTLGVAVIGRSSLPSMPPDSRSPPGSQPGQRRPRASPSAALSSPPARSPTPDSVPSPRS
jgi:hypothetical protein